MASKKQRQARNRRRRHHAAARAPVPDLSGLWHEQFLRRGTSLWQEAGVIQLEAAVTAADGMPESELPQLALIAGYALLWPATFRIASDHLIGIDRWWLWPRLADALDEPIEQAREVGDLDDVEVLELCQYRLMDLAIFCKLVAAERDVAVNRG